VEAIRDDVENTGDDTPAKRVIVPCERTIPQPSRFSLLHYGQERNIDHLLVSQSLLARYRGSEFHNELLHDGSVAFGIHVKFPESDHAPVIAEFALPDDLSHIALAIIDTSSATFGPWTKELDLCGRSLMKRLIWSALTGALYR
jgi:hypothetical protein